MKTMVKLINRLIRHDRDLVGDFGIRAVIHIPNGFFAGLLDWTNAFTHLFIYYEDNEDAHTKDQAWKDVYGALVGFVIGRLVLAGLIVWLICYLVTG